MRYNTTYQLRVNTCKSGRKFGKLSPKLFMTPVRTHRVQAPRNEIATVSCLLEQMARTHGRPWFQASNSWDSHYNYNWLVVWNMFYFPIYWG